MNKQLINLEEKLYEIEEKLYKAVEKYGHNSPTVDNLSRQCGKLEREHSALLREMGEQEY